MKTDTELHAHAQPWKVLQRAVALLALACAAYFVGAFAFVAVSRIGYPFALEALEGGSLQQVDRILSGQPVYVQPHMDYIAVIYPPLYFFASALVARVIGFGFLALRLVSLASALGSFTVIALIVRHETGRWLEAALGAALFAATYYLTGSWFDIGRVDMLSVFLVLLAIWLLRRHGTLLHLLAAAVFAAAVLTKQTHLITLVCLLPYLAILERRKLLTFVVPCLALLFGVYLLLDHLYQGWFGFFVLRLAMGSGEFVALDLTQSLQTARDFWLNSIILALPFAVLSIAFYVADASRSGQARPRLLFYLSCAAGLMGTSWSVVQVGGYKNDVIPAYAALSVLFGLSLSWLASKCKQGSSWHTAILGACIVQFALLVYPIASQVPSKADVAAGEALVQQIRNLPGDVYIPFHPELALLAGKKPFTSWGPMYILEGHYGGGNVRAAGRVKTEFSRAMERQQFSMIILDEEPNWIWGDPERYYFQRPEPVFSDTDVFWPVTGWQIRPEIVLIPIPK